MVERVNFASDQVGDATKPGVRRILERLAALGPVIAPEALVDACQDAAGLVPVAPLWRDELIAHVRGGGEVRCGTPGGQEAFGQRVTGLLRLMVTSREFQLA